MIFIRPIFSPPPPRTRNPPRPPHHSSPRPRFCAHIPHPLAAGRSLAEPPALSAELGLAPSTLSADGFETILHDYPDQKWAQDTINGIRTGFSCELDASHISLMPRDPNVRNLPMDADATRAAIAYVNAQCKAGLMAGPFSRPAPDAIVSRIGAIPPKAPGKAHRVIFDLSTPGPGEHGISVNEATSSPSFKAASFKKIWRWLKKTGNESIWMGTQDVRSAYRHIAIAPHLLRFFWFRLLDGFYCDKAASFGWKESGYLWDRVGQVLDWARSREIGSAAASGRLLDQIGATRDAGSSRYVDDIGSLAFSQEACDDHMGLSARGMDIAGVTRATEKDTPACQRIKYLGVGVDSTQKFIFIPREKAARIADIMRGVLAANRLDRREAESLAAKCFAVACVIPAAAFASHHIREAGKGHHRINKRGSKISPAMRSELNWWLTLLTTQDSTEGGPEPFVRSFAPSVNNCELHWASSAEGYVWGWIQTTNRTDDDDLSCTLKAYGHDRWADTTEPGRTGENISLFTRATAWACNASPRGGNIRVHIAEEGPQECIWEICAGRTPKHSTSSRKPAIRAAMDNRRAIIAEGARALWTVCAAKCIDIHFGESRISEERTREAWNNPGFHTARGMRDIIDGSASPHNIGSDGALTLISQTDARRLFTPL